MAPYPQHMTGILGPIEKYHSKDSSLQKFFKKSEKGGQQPPLNPPMLIVWPRICKLTVNCVFLTLRTM